MHHQIIRKRGKEELTFHDGSVPYFSFPNMDKAGIKNGFSTKFGGISTGFYAEMNLGISASITSKEILPEPFPVVSENYRRILETLGMNREHAVLTNQTHTVNVRIVTEKDHGKGPLHPRDYDNVDGLVTNLTDTPLISLHADCVPVLFYDPVSKAIGIAHAGWKGTVHNIAHEILAAMKHCYGSEPQNVLAAIGPSICKDCYEVSEDVYQIFKEAYPDQLSQIISPNQNNRWQLDLWEANRINLIQEGVLASHIFVTDVCTKCNHPLLYSHRATGPKRGLLAAFISL